MQQSKQCLTNPTTNIT